MTSPPRWPTEPAGQGGPGEGLARAVPESERRERAGSHTQNGGALGLAFPEH